MHRATVFWIEVLLVLTVASCQTETAPDAALQAPYAVGSQTRFIHDYSRGYDSVGGIDAGVRILITEVWYPVDHAVVAEDAAGYRRATYGDYVFGDREMHRLMMTQTTFFHLTPDSVRDGVSLTEINATIDELFVRERNSYVDAPPATSQNPWPVVVMSHGDAGSRYNMETACEYLAAHGYLVIAPEHTGNSPYSLTGRDPALAATGGDSELQARMADVMPHLDNRGAYGNHDTYGQSYAPLGTGLESSESLVNLDDSLVQRVNDLRATLDELEEMNHSGPFAKRLALGRIGLMGRSFGGTTTLAALALEPRLSAGMAVVPYVLPDVRSSLPAELLRPSGQESVLLSTDGPFALGEIRKPMLLLSGAEDALIIGANASLAALVGAPAPTPVNPHPLLRTAFETADQPVVWGLLHNSNHSSFGVSGSYWWPQLKPGTQPRYFEPETSFMLVDPEIAHRMQRVKALQFFDLFIRGDSTARSRLLDNRFAEDGLILEARNL